MGIDPVTHKPKSDALGSVVDDGNTKNAANLSHMAQWESARLEAEARLVRESKLRSAAAAAAVVAASSSSSTSSSSSSSAPPIKQPPTPSGVGTRLPCLDVLKAWQGVWSSSKSNKGSIIPLPLPLPFPFTPNTHDLESPTSTLSFSSDNTTHSIPTVGLAAPASAPPPPPAVGNKKNDSNSTIDFINYSSSVCKEESSDDDKVRQENSVVVFPLHDLDHHHHDQVHVAARFQPKSKTTTTRMIMTEGRWPVQQEYSSSSKSGPLSLGTNFADDEDDGSFTDLLMVNGHHDHINASDGGSSDNINANGEEEEEDDDDNDEAKNYWNSILNLVNSSPSESPLF